MASDSSPPRFNNGVSSPDDSYSSPIPNTMSSPSPAPRHRGRSRRSLSSTPVPNTSRFATTPSPAVVELAIKLKNWSLGNELFVISGETSTDDREWAMEPFNNSPDAKILFGSMRACGEGIWLVGASHIIILDVPLNPSVTWQAIGRAFRPGLKRKVNAYRLVAADSPEEDDHYMCFEKELIYKMWFKWNEYSGFRDLKIQSDDVRKSGDEFLETPILAKDVKALYKWSDKTFLFRLQIA